MMVGVHPIQALFLLFLLSALTRPCLADTSIARPMGKDGGPPSVEIAVGLLDVDEIDGAAQSFTANFYFEARWSDPRLAHEGKGTLIFPVTEVWTPQGIFVNQQRIHTMLPEVVEVSPSGEVYYKQHIWGQFSQPLEVSDFPFDTQTFQIRLASANSFQDELVFVLDADVRSGIAAEFSLPDWEILGWELKVDPFSPLGRAYGRASFALSFTAKRHGDHYVVKIILPMILIVAMSWIVFWVDPKESATQIGVATTSMLTLIAYRFAVGGMVPTVPYLTRMDIFILFSTILVFMALLQAVLTSNLARRNALGTARYIDCACRIIYPSVFVLISYFALLRP